jgi:quinoprotein glucose dehydrogenase
MTTLASSSRASAASRGICTSVLAIAVLSCAQPGRTAAREDVDWRVTGGEPGMTRWSPLDQITRDNVKKLRVAWVYHAGDASTQNRSEIQATPIVVRGVLYSTSPSLALFALRAATGQLLWRFDPFAGQSRRESHVNRGVAYWESGTDQRLFYTAGRRIWCVNAATGRPVPSFGTGGSIDLATGIDRDVS